MKMQRFLSLLTAAALLLCVLGGCGNTTDLEATDAPTETPDASTTEQPQDSTEASAKIGVVLTTSGLGDNNFNDMVYAGLQQAQADLGITFDYVEPSSPDEYTSMTYSLAQDGSYDLIIVLSSDGATALDEIAPQYPDQKFTLVDNASDNPNVCNILKTARSRPSWPASSPGWSLWMRAWSTPTPTRRWGPSRVWTPPR